MAESSAIERALIQGDLSKLTENERLSYYKQLCESLGLNPLTKPFQYMTLQGKMILYAGKDCTEQLRRLHGVSITDLKQSVDKDICTFIAKAKNKEGREDVASGAVNIKGMAGDSLANAVMKAETKAKRRVTLSICGLGMLDETELETIPSSGLQLAEGPKLNMVPYETPQKPESNIPPENDEIFEIGKQMKGKKFSEMVVDQGFLKFVNEALEKNYAKSHEQLKRFHRFAIQHGAYTK